MVDFKIINIEKHHKEDIYKLIEEINLEDGLNYSLTEEWLDYVIENASGGIFLAFYGDILAGLATCMINSLYMDQGALSVVVSPSYRKKGLGSILYDKIYDYGQSENLAIVEAYVKERLIDGVKFAGSRDFNTIMYSWEMELDLGGVDLVFDKVDALEFREAREEDGLIYRNIILDGFADDLGEDALFQTLQDPSVLVYILEKENQAIGSATVQLRKDLSLAYIYDIVILDDYRGQGLGSYLVKSCVMNLKGKGIDKASLLVTGENKSALELYRKLGFKEVDIDLIMTKRV